MVNSFLISVVSILFNFIEGAIFLDVIFSWIMPGRKNAFLDLLHVFTDPFMMPGRKIQERIMPGLMVDFSPIIALLIIGFLKGIVIRAIILFS